MVRRSHGAKCRSLAGWLCRGALREKGGEREKREREREERERREREILD